MSKLLEYELTEAEFDQYVTSQNLPLINADTKSDDKYMMYGSSLSSDVKFKNYVGKNGKDAFKLQLTTPEEIQCVPCGIKFKSEKNPEQCPLCGEKIYDILDRNRRFEEEWTRYEQETTRKLEDDLREKQPALLVKYKLMTEEQAAEHKVMLEANKK